jgi:beta-mannosidase
MDFRKGQPAVDLCGEWFFAYGHEPLTDVNTISAVERAGYQLHPCTVPGNFELDLQAIGVIEDPFFGMNMVRLREFEDAHVFYFRRFEASPPPATNAVLAFDGLDCCAEVYLNGKLLGYADNMLVEHCFPVDGLLQDDNELVVHILPAVAEAKRYDYPPSLVAQGVNYESLYIRKAPHMYGWDIMPRAVSAGIWRPVRLRFLPVERLEEVFLETTGLSASRADLVLHYKATTSGGAHDVYEIQVDSRCDPSAFSLRRRIPFQAGRLGFAVENPAIWWPRGRGQAKLYDVSVSLLKNGGVLDHLTFTHGIRTAELLRTSVTGPAGEGEFCFRINGEKTFIKGTNWVPLDAFHSRDLSRIPPAMELVEDIGCNMLRCWGGNVYENDLFFELCDRKGIMVWQDFAMACAAYPQDEEFQRRIAEESRAVVKRLRQHPSLVLWSGDNECDHSFQWAFGKRHDPNENVLTRKVIPGVLAEEDRSRPYLPSSPYISPEAFEGGLHLLPEDHLWGPRDYYKSDFYRTSLCHFASEIGYHGCPSPESLRRFISPEKLWPYEDNDEWLLHCTSPVPEAHLYDYRVELMARQIRELFGEVPDNLDDFAFASQACQAEAKKFFIEMFRAAKWRRTGIIWWNVLDGWPQLSDAVVDYYFTKKLAYDFIKTSQQPLCLILCEPANFGQALIASNDTREDIALQYTITDLTTDAVVAQGAGIARADSVTALGSIPFSMGAKRFYVIEWTSPAACGRNHYLAGQPPFDLAHYRDWLAKARIRAR